jgi:hypothetical protein
MDDLGFGEGELWQMANVFLVFRVLFVVTTYFAVIDLKERRHSGESAQKTPHNAHLGV